MAADLLELQGGIRTMMLAGASLGEVESEVIDPSGLDDEAKSALWLYAWSFIPEGEQRDEALSHLGRMRVTEG